MLSLLASRALALGLGLLARRLLSIVASASRLLERRLSCSGSRVAHGGARRVGAGGEWDGVTKRRGGERGEVLTGTRR
jgi:hypothetical protein